MYASKPASSEPDGWRGNSKSVDRVLEVVVVTIMLVVGLGLGLGLPEDASMPYPYNRVAQVSGWLYFSAWSLSFYPQTYLNWKRRSVVGFSFDFALVNPIGFLCYAIYNVAFVASPHVRKEYAERHHGATSAVHFNDVFFSVHAFAIASVMLLQCAIYERGGQRVSPFCIRATAAMVLASVIYGVFVASIPSISVLNFLYFLSYIKLAITLVKYTPQAYLNYKRRSTVGWNIGTVLLDIFGGLLSLFQLFLEAFVKRDWGAVTGDPIKFGLGFVSVAFDVIFMVQHYILYPESRDGRTNGRGGPGRYILVNPADLAPIAGQHGQRGQHDQQGEDSQALLSPSAHSRTSTMSAEVETGTRPIIARHPSHQSLEVRSTQPGSTGVPPV